MTTAGIYWIRHIPTGKKYIGQSIKCRIRKSSHFWNLRRHTHRNEYLQRAFNKHGEQNFDFTVIEDCDPKDLDCRERAWIKYYGTTDERYGYNVCVGGDVGATGLKRSQETIIKMRATQSNRSPEWRRRISDAKMGEKNPMYGKKQSEKHKNAIRAANLGTKRSKESKQKMSEAMTAVWRKGRIPNACGPDGRFLRIGARFQKFPKGSPKMPKPSINPLGTSGMIQQA